MTADHDDDDGDDDDDAVNTLIRLSIVPVFSE